jgi:hypothetical protein
LLEKNAIARDFAARLAVGRARHGQADGARRAMAR